MANLIQGEHPQTISLILAYLRPEQAAVVISNLPENLQIEVSTRMATMERAGLEVVKEVEAVLYDKFFAVLYNSEKHAQVGGVKALAGSTGSTGPPSATSWKTWNGSIRNWPSGSRNSCSSSTTSSSSTIGRSSGCCGKSKAKDLALALKGATESVKERIFRNMSERAGRMLKDDIETMGPVRLKDVEEVQQKVVNVVRRLEEAGEIIISRGGDDIVI